MQFERVAKIYRETNLSTMSIIEYTILLLQECLSMVQSYEAHRGNEQKEVLSKAQDILFELMSVTNQKTHEGNRLFNFYIHLNQCLIEVHIHQDQQQLERVKHYLTEMIVAWEEAKPVGKRYSYKRHDLQT